MTIEIIGIVWLFVTALIGHCLIAWGAYKHVRRTLDLAKLGERKEVTE